MEECGDDGSTVEHPACYDLHDTAWTAEPTQSNHPALVHIAVSVPPPNSCGSPRCADALGHGAKTINIA
jgi:hypothetical protein